MSDHAGHSALRDVPPAVGDAHVRDATAAAVARNTVWYHTLELPGGVVTPGHIDLRKVAKRLLPRDLRGRRALDVGTFDGFWAFELERRGAEVVAIDLEAVEDSQIPPNSRELIEREAKAFDVKLGRGFEIASELLGSSATRVICDVLDLTPEAIGGPVDVVFLGAVLIHLRDPVRALERIHATLVPGGELYQLEAISLPLTLRHPRSAVACLQTLGTGFNWWYPNWATLRTWLSTAGFVDIRNRGLYRPPQLRPMNDRLCGIRSRRPA